MKARKEQDAMAPNKSTNQNSGHEDCALGNYPTEQTYLLFTLANVLCQCTNLDSKGVYTLLHAFGVSVAEYQHNPMAAQVAAEGLRTCEGDIHALIATLSDTMPQVVKQSRVTTRARH